MPPSKNQVSKPPKIFISHKTEDAVYSDALINLINFVIGSDGDKVFCSSVQGYGIRQACDIMEELRSQFVNNEIFMIIIHSPKYYKSAICMNEMGAAWALGSRFCSFLTKDCKPEQMQGVVGKERIYIDPNGDADMLNAHLNDFKNDLVSFFHCETPDENKWENARNRFVREVLAIEYKNVPEEKPFDSDFFENHYLNAFDHIFDLLDIENFTQWGNNCAISGYAKLSADVYDNLDNVVGYIKSRPNHSSYQSWDALRTNLGELVADFERVFSLHLAQFGDHNYYVEPFYKIRPFNEKYEKDVEAYRQHVFLISDMVFELARLCNLILYRIRLMYPDYRNELGVLYLENDLSAPDLVYAESEISDAPYPGLDEFIKVRLTREVHYGTNPNIRPNGYMKA